MGITDVIRGDDHLYNTPKQLVVYNALNFDIPKFYHVAMINNEQGKKLSKRDGATDVMDYKAMGYLPEALLNFLIRLGWSHGDQEIFSLDEMKELFSPNDINKSSSNYNLDKLLWLNAHYIKNKSDDELIELLKDFGVDLSGHTKASQLLDATKERGKTLVELAEQIKLIVDAPTGYDEKSMKKAFKDDTAEILTNFSSLLQESSPSTKEQYHDAMQSLVSASQIGFGKLAMPLRLALLGKMTGSDLDEIMHIIGTDEVVSRISNILK